MAQSHPTVCVSFDWDGPAVWMAGGARDARSLSRGDFGARVGIPRILDLCERMGIAATWFATGHAAETFPGVAAEIATRGHEIACHGYLHEDFEQLSLDDARAVIKKAAEALERTTGQRPRGMRFPPWAVDAALFQVLLDEGFAYSSSLMDECKAHWATGPGTVRDDGPNVPGPELDLVELPVTFITSDFSYFEFNGYGRPALPAGLRNARDVEQIWRDEFDYMREREPEAYVVLMLHPESIGWGSRVAMLERTLEYFASFSDVRFVTAETIAEEFRAEAKAGVAG